MRRLTRLVLAAGLALGGGAAVSAPAHAAACSSTSGVTVVVTFPGGSTVTRCAPGDPSSGAAALSAAGFSVTRVVSFPGAVCQIDSAPTTSCQRMPPTSAYWSYWHATRGGSWTYSSVGFDSYDPAPGSVEGWAFGGGTAPAVAPPPPVAQPKPAPRPSTTSLAPRVPSTGPTTRTATTSAAPRPSTSGAATGSGPGPVVVVSNGATQTTSAPSRSATTTSSDAATSTSPTTAATGLPSTGTDLAGERTAAPASTPWSLVAGVLAIAALGLTAFAARRRRAAH